MIKKLYTIKFGYAAKCTDEQLKLIQTIDPEAHHFDLEHFSVPSYSRNDDKYLGWTEEQFDTHMHVKYAEYLAKESREFGMPFNSDAMKFVDLDTLLALDLDIPFEIVATHKLNISDHSGQMGFDMHEYTNMFKTLEHLSHQLEDRKAFNEKCNVHIGGGHLMTINRTMLCEDYCTDNLQKRLSEGWRIIAVTVQEARRPDYILGKYDPMCTNTLAERG